MPCGCSRKIPRYIDVKTPVAPIGKRFATSQERSDTPYGKRYITPEEYKKLSQKKPSLK